MALQFTGNRNAKMSSVVAIDWDNVTGKPGVVLYDIDQGLNSTQREQARENIAAVGYDAQTLNQTQKNQVQTNIGPWNDTSAVSASVNGYAAASSFYENNFFGNPATGKVSRFNRLLIGLAAHQSGETPTPNPTWVNQYFGGVMNSGSISIVNQTGQHGVVAVTRSSDFRAWAGSTTGGAQPINGFAVNDDLTPATTPIVAALYGEAVHVSGCNGITIGQQNDVGSADTPGLCTANSGNTSKSVVGLQLTTGFRAGVGFDKGASLGLTIGNFTASAYRFLRGQTFLRNGMNTAHGRGGNGIAIEFASGHSQVWVGSETTGITISVASPGVVTWTAHGFSVNAPVCFRGFGIPTGLTEGITYYVRTVLTANTFTVAATPGGTEINTTAANSGAIVGWQPYAEIYGNVDGLQSLTPILTPRGSASNPVYAFSGDADTGFFSTGANQIAVSVAGAQASMWGSSGTFAVGTSDTFRQFTVGQTNSPTDTVQILQRLKYATVGTPAAGIGVGMEFQVETAADNFEVGATIEAVTTDVTAASEDFDLVFKTMSAGATAAERMRLLSTGGIGLPSGSVINWNSGDVTATHSANTLTIGGGDFVVASTTAATSHLTGALRVAGGLGVADSAHFGGNLDVGELVGTGSAGIEIAADRTGDGIAYLDLHSQAGTDYEFRILRAAGANGTTSIFHQGTGDFLIGSEGSASVVFRTNNTTRAFVNAATAGFVVRNNLRIYDNTAVPAGGTTGTGLTMSSTANLGVFFGSGAPTLSAAQGSLYIRTDGSSTSTRLYVNTNGTTGWTNVTTAT